MDYEDIIFDKKDRIVRITINRPQRYNACTQQTGHKLIDTLKRGMDNEIGAIVLTGQGEKAFCTGGDQATREKGGYKGEHFLPLEVGW